MPYNETRGVEEPDGEDPTTPRAILAITLAGLPALTGMPSDVSAAEGIRSARLIEADTVLSEMRGNEAMTEEHAAAAFPPPHVTHAQVQQAQTALNRLRHQTDAGWWLAHQNDTAQALLDLFRAEG